MNSGHELDLEAVVSPPQTPEIKARIARYIDLLKATNEHTNLYSKSAYDRLSFHIADCLTLAALIGNNELTVLDMGSGSGLPAIPIAVANPENRVFAVESRGKKARFLECVKTELKLENLTVVNMDVHEFIVTQLGVTLATADLMVTAKAFGAYDKIAGIIRRVPKVSGERRLWVPVSQIQAEDLQKKRVPITMQNGFRYVDQAF